MRRIDYDKLIKSKIKYNMEKIKKNINIYIDETLCKGCNICIEFCNENVFIASEKINSLGYYVPVPANISKCNACMICELMCPELSVVLEKSDLVAVGVTNE